MAATVTNLLMGPCDLYIASFGATEPALGTWTTPSSAVWTDAGGTMGGVKMGVAMKFSPLEVDQVPDDVGQRMTGRTITIETMLAETTVENVKSLMNGGTITAGGGASLGTGTIVASTGVITCSASHGLAVGDPVILGAITSTTGVTAGVVYYVLTAPSSTTFTLSATPGGAPLSLTTNGSTASITKATYKSFEPLTSAASFQPTYSAILLRGAAPGGNVAFYRHIIGRKVLSTDGFEFEQAKDKQAGFKAKWSLNYVSSSIAPFSIIDELS